MAVRMKTQAPSPWTRRLAKICLNCVACRQARAKQRGVAFWFVQRVEGGVCPCCRAYARVYGRKPHEPLT
jgi:uncharacterized protein CbrC (UPF0167 family)